MPAVRTSKRALAVIPETFVSTGTTRSSASSVRSIGKAPLQPAALNELSRLLKKRLEFARIKVENGWTKKSIVDIEALMSPTPSASAQALTKAASQPRYPASLTSNPTRPLPKRQQSIIVPQGQVTLGFERLPSGVDFPAPGPQSPSGLY